MHGSSLLHVCSLVQTHARTDQATNHDTGLYSRHVAFYLRFTLCQLLHARPADCLLIIGVPSQAVAGFRVGVTSEPELCVTELTPDDAFIILASDGVWEFIGTQEAVDIIGSSKTVEEGCRSVRTLL